jgi:predicted amidohydrolase YtcJ
MTTTRLLALLAAALCCLPAWAQPQLYTNANIYTLDPANPRADAMLVENGLIAAIGSEAHVRRAMRELGVRVFEGFDLEGRTVIPGLIDAHGHMIGLGAIGLGLLDLRATESYEEVITLVRDRARKAPPGAWIVGRGWDHESWPERELPHHTALSEAVPDHPVWLSRVDGHAGLANAKAMEVAGVSGATPSPPGGEVLLDHLNEPTGVFVDNAERLIARHVPAGTTGSAEECILKAQEMCLAAGLTAVHDAGVSPTEVAVYKRLEAEGRLKIRIYAMLHGRDAPDYFEREGVHDSFKLSVYAAKAYIDGAMGSRGAWLLEPYEDRPTDPGGRPYSGLAVTDPSEIERLATHALNHSYQLCTHAIGDRANREVLDAYGRALDATRNTRPPEPDARLRIEHAQLLHPDDFPRFAELGVIASMQPTHCTSDMRWVDARVGTERAAGAYAWASLLRADARLAFGSDFPVESHNPFLGLHAAITRQTTDGVPDRGWHPEQRLTREEALRAFTIDAAYAAYWERRTGTLEVGKLADFLVLDRDIMTCDADHIPDTQVLRTYSAGELLFSHR